MNNSWIFKIGLIFIFCAAKISGHLNLYLNLHEVLRLLGVSAELYYVRDGQLNDYALNFVLPVPANMQEITFSWQSLTKTPLPYSINIMTSDPEVLPRPTLNISRIGEIPMTSQTFAIGMKCSGQRAANVDIKITLEIILNKTTNNIIELVLKRKKNCAITIPEPTSEIDTEQHDDLDDINNNNDNHNNNNNNNNNILPETIIPSHRSEMTALLIGGILALVLITILISIAFCGKGSSKPQNNGSQLVKTSSFQHLQGPPGYALKSIYSSPSDAVMLNNSISHFGGQHHHQQLQHHRHQQQQPLPHQQQQQQHHYYHHHQHQSGGAATAATAAAAKTATIQKPIPPPLPPPSSSTLLNDSIHYSSGTLGGYLRPPLRLPTTSGHYNQCSDFGESYYMSIDERI